MIQVPITREEREYAWSQISKKSIAHRGIFDGSKEHQYTGFLGEVVLANIFNLPTPTTERGFDNGVDFELYGVKFDLKTVGRWYDPKPQWANNLVVSQMQYDTEAYMFASINKFSRIITFTGMLSKKDAERYPINKKGDVLVRDDGKEIVLQADHREIPNYFLHPLDKWDDVFRFAVSVEKPNTVRGKV
jgi:hypothetical protein